MTNKDEKTSKLTDIGKASPNLIAMIAKLDARSPSSAGYITNPSELQAILGELSSQVSVGIFENEQDYSRDLVSVEIKVRLSLSREELGLDS
jgi:hypothetical protein